jgi:gamma-glutamyltranspeptidase/glutathione hydrolase
MTFSSSTRRLTKRVCRVHVASLAAPAIGAFLLTALPSRAAFGPSAEGRSVAVATDSADASRAAMELLSAGGNAVDGAIAAALALGVVNPTASGLGGGGFALVYSAKDRRVVAYDFRETAPAKYDAGALYPPPKKGEAPKPRWSWRGPRGVSVGVPGEPAGLELLSRKYGRKSLSDDAAPAIALAQSGFYLPKHTAEVVAFAKERIAGVPALASAFLPGGTPAPFASRVKRPALAKTLARFGAEGKRSIYEGETARKIADAVTAAGGTMTAQDVSSYAVRERAPLSRTIDGRTIFTMPAPSAGGLMVLETIAMFGASKSSPLAAMGFGSSAYLHTIAEAMRGAFADRARLAGDPDLDPGVDRAFEAALDPAQLAARRAKIDPDKTHAPQEFKTREQGTTHLVVADADGNVVTLTTTVNGPFGASIVAGDTGIVLNNQLDDFSSPDDAKAFGVPGGGPNRPRARARAVSSMAPTIVIQDGAPILALGGSGGTRIATGVTEAALARLVFDLDPNACVSSPRIHTQGADLLVDKDVAVDVRKALEARGEKVKEEPFMGSAVQVIAWERPRAPSGGVRLLAASDPRKGGLALAR